jgi:hypothetical protein
LKNIIDKKNKIRILHIVAERFDRHKRVQKDKRFENLELEGVIFTWQRKKQQKRKKNKTLHGTSKRGNIKNNVELLKVPRCFFL